MNRNTLKSACQRIGQFARSEEGPTATEYAVMLTMLLMAIFGTLGVFGTTVGNLFTDIQASLFA